MLNFKVVDMVHRVLLFLILVSLAFVPLSSLAGDDPTYAATIKGAGIKSNAVIKGQVGVQTLTASQHIWYRDGVQTTAEYIDQYNKYLESLHDILTTVAQIYGLYLDVNRTIKWVGDLTEAMEDAPLNILAVAMHSQRNRIYERLYVDGVAVVMDIKKALFESKAKMSEFERFKAFLNIKERLRSLNNSLSLATMYLRHTTLADVWRQSTKDRYRFQKTRAEIAAECVKDWQWAMKTTR